MEAEILDGFAGRVIHKGMDIGNWGLVVGRWSLVISGDTKYSKLSTGVLNSWYLVVKVVLGAHGERIADWGLRRRARIPAGYGRGELGLVVKACCGWLCEAGLAGSRPGVGDSRYSLLVFSGNIRLYSTSATRLAEWVAKN